jgi:protein-disulfide isomerase
MATLKVPVTEEDHIQGNLNAPIVLVEYGDYECPACGYAYPIVKRLQQHFGKNLCLVFRNFPLSEAHPHAELAAETAEFAADYQRFWEMHDLLYENQNRFETATFLELAGRLGLATEELNTALDTGTYTDKVQKDFIGGVRSGVNGTPTFYINGERHNDSYEYEVIVMAIEALLRKRSEMG